MSVRTAAGRYWSGKRKRASAPKLAPSTRKAVSAVIKRTIRAKEEFKFYDQSLNSNTGATNPVNMQGLTPNTASLNQLTAVVQGASDNTRVGDRLDMTSLDFMVNFKFESAVTAATTAATVRVILLQFLGDTSIAALTSAQVLQTIIFATTYQQPNHDFKPLIKVLYDKVRVINNGANNSTTFRGRVKPSTKRLQFQNGTTSGRGHLYLLVVADNQDNLGGAVEFWYTTRLNYTDS